MTGKLLNGLDDTPGNRRKAYDFAGVARGLRTALAEGFPGVRFSVRTELYNGGGAATIVIRWTDGPTEAAVNRVCILSPDAARFVGTRTVRTRRADDLIGRPPPPLGAQLARLHQLTARAAAEKPDAR